MRCNHCTDAPCVKICPTQGALQARTTASSTSTATAASAARAACRRCPYDAIYIDEDTHTAAKCNFCAHRIDEDIEPACVVVCPTHSIWVGDLDDPTSGISRLINSHRDQPSARPSRTPAPTSSTSGPTGPCSSRSTPRSTTPTSGRIPTRTASRWPATCAARPSAAPAPRYNTAHPRPWGWKVTTYLWTKGVSAGVLLVAALAMILGADLGVLGTVVAPAIALVTLAATGALLVWDLKRPERFLYLFLKPNPTSWLFWGSVALAVYAVVAGLWFLAGLAVELDLYDATTAIDVLAWLAIPAAVMAAGYTGFLFGQAEGRDLWQSPLLFWHLQIQALMVGAGALAVALLVTDTSADGERLVVRTLALATAAHVVMLARRVRRPARHPSRGRGGAPGHPRPVRRAVLVGGGRPGDPRRGRRRPQLERHPARRRGRGGPPRPGRPARVRERLRARRPGRPPVVKEQA